jgi:hypothetical protein
MQKAPPHPLDFTWTRRAVTLGLIASMVGGVVFWIMQIMGVSHQVPDLRFTRDSSETFSAVDPSTLAKALGGGAIVATQQAPASLSLVAVVNRQGSGAALISIDGQKAQAFQPGDQVQPGRYLIQLGLRSAELGPSPQGAPTEQLSISVPKLPTDGK